MPYFVAFLGINTGIILFKNYLTLCLNVFELQMLVGPGAVSYRSLLLNRIVVFIVEFMPHLLIFSFLDFPVGAEPRAVPCGSVSLSMLFIQPAGWRASQPQAPTGFCFTAHKVSHGAPGHLLRLFLPCSGTHTHPHSPTPIHTHPHIDTLACICIY